MEKFEKLVDQEENRCREIVGRIKSTLAAEDALRREKSLEIKELEQQKLAAEGWREKREIGELIGTAREQNARRLYQDDGVIKQPYFAILGIDDDKLGVRSYCLGRQSFFDSKHHVLIVDWREAPISRLFYEYEAGEIYEELIRGRNGPGPSPPSARSIPPGESCGRLSSGAFTSSGRQTGPGGEPEPKRPSAGKKRPRITASPRSRPSSAGNSSGRSPSRILEPSSCRAGQAAVRRRSGCTASPFWLTRTRTTFCRSGFSWSCSIGPCNNTSPGCSLI